MALEYIDDLYERAVAKLLGQFRTAPNFLKLLTAVTGELQELMEVVFSLVGERSLSGAEGAQLDQYGTIVSEAREGMDDTDYRAIVRTRIQVNQSRGELWRMYDILERLTDALLMVIIDQQPAAVMVYYMVPTELSAVRRTRTLRLFELAMPAGVSLIGMVESIDGYFGFHDDPDAKGFDDGTWSELIS